jgi:hypothetical protein
MLIKFAEHAEIEGQERAVVPADTMSALLAAVKEMKG